MQGKHHGLWGSELFAVGFATGFLLRMKKYKKLPSLCCTLLLTLMIEFTMMWFGLLKHIRFYSTDLETVGAQTGEQ